MFMSAEPDLWFSTDEEKGEYFFIYYDSIMVVGSGGGWWCVYSVKTRTAPAQKQIRSDQQSLSIT